MKANEPESTIWRMIHRGALQRTLRGGRGLVAVEGIDNTKSPRKVDAIPPLTPDHPIFRLVGGRAKQRRAPRSAG